MEIFKTIEEYPNYEFSSQNRLRNKETGKFLKLNESNCFRLCKEGKQTNIAVSKLKQKYFPVEIEYLPNEIFLIIDGFPNYEISNRGRVYNNKTGTFLTPQLNKHGYYYVVLCKNSKRKYVKIHRLVAIAFIPNPNNLPEVDHIDRNKLNNHISNLRWVSRSENSINTLTKKNKYGNHITKTKKGKYWIISINHKNFKFRKNYRTDQYTLEEVVEIRNEKYKKGNIKQLDAFKEVYV